jgi:hypothetical protein
MKTGAVWLGIAIGLMALLGGLDYATHASALEPFDMNGELAHGFYFPALFSAGLLLAAAVAAWSVGHGTESLHRQWLAIAGLFAFMGVDEVVMLHERLQDWSGVDWQLLYLPLVATAAVVWIQLLPAFRSSPPIWAMWISGAGFWLVAQVAEHFEFSGQGHPVGLTPELILIEETFEMTGSALLLLAVLAFASRMPRRAVAARGPTRVAA